METRVSSATKEVIISGERPTVLIGERINPTGKKKLAAALQAGDLDLVRQEALAQVQAKADILDVNVGIPEVDEATLLPRAIRAVMDVVDVPLSIDSSNPKALAAALETYRGKALINSVTGQNDSLEQILPLVKEHQAAVVGLTMDEEGIPTDADGRVSIARKIVERATAMGIPREDIIIDCLSMPTAADNKTAIVIIEAIRRIRAELGLNQTMGTSNVSFGLPDRPLLNSAFLAMVIQQGVTCPVVDVAKVRPFVLATDALLGRDMYMQRYIQAFRERDK
ncbi:MAG: dihydropteroate synthase [Dehalococcoidia bacterium]|nr:dihydropteroate synthase [Chloroflexota bacterium]MCK4221235.1 dihydropteroate synthase [Dehalococcoidia bacterium]MCK4581221.1 dihydropteroate synthase [Dehalococcoidia bacterium]